MLPRVIPADFHACAINFIAVGADSASSEINQLPYLDMNAFLKIDAPFQSGERCADGRQRQRRTGRERVALTQRINEDAITGDVVERRAHAPAGVSANAPSPDCLRNSRRCSYIS